VHQHYSGDVENWPICVEFINKSCIIKVKLHLAWLVLGFGDLWQVYYSRPLSLAIPLCVGTVSSGDGFGHRWGRNGEFCVAVCPVTRTAGILAYCMLA